MEQLTEASIPITEAGFDVKDGDDKLQQRSSSSSAAERAEPPKRYTFEQWTRFGELIRFTPGRGSAGDQANLAGDTEDGEDGEDGEDEGLLEWDWIGEDSPMLADTTEAQWVLYRLCESLNRYTRHQAQRQAGLTKTETIVDENPELLVAQSSPATSSSWPARTSEDLFPTQAIN
ncbi:MAG: Potassium channel [Sporothrix thermara]